MWNRFSKSIGSDKKLLNSYLRLVNGVDSCPFRLIASAADRITGTIKAEVDRVGERASI